MQGHFWGMCRYIQFRRNIHLCAQALGTLAVAMMASLGRSLHKVRVEAGKKYSPGNLFSTILATASHSRMSCENVP